MKDRFTRIDSLYKNRVNKIKILVAALNDFIRPLTPAMLTAKLFTEGPSDDGKDPRGICLAGLKENPDLTEQYVCPACFKKNSKTVAKLLKKLEDVL